MKDLFITLKNKDLEVEFCTKGASIYSIKFHNELMNLTFKNKDEYVKHDYHGKTIGRVANRITGNKLTIDGETYILENNEGNNVLHGGLNGLSTKTFDYEIFDNKIKFHYLSKDGESGFPGNVSIDIIYTLENDAIILEQIAETLDKTTPINLTNHLYFTLGDNCIDNLSLLLPAKSYIFTNPKDMTVIEEKPLINPLNFNKMRKIVENIDSEEIKNDMEKGYDHFYILDGNINNGNINLSNDRYSLVISTDYEGAQLYSDNFTNPYKFINSDLSCRKGIAIEPSMSLLKNNLIKKGEKYTHKICYSFIKL